tara:strand:- start:231 stop:440 length:210 start_codon:yes stop_codon:yes gene_type:complete
VLGTFRLKRAEPIQKLPLVHPLRPKRGRTLAISAAATAAAIAAAIGIALASAASAAAADGVGQHEELLA